MDSKSYTPFLSFFGRVEQASYHEQDLEDYANNPLIEALPPILLGDEPEKLLARYPAYKEEDRKLAPELRYHLTQKVTQFFQPLPIHLDLQQRVSCMLRAGYVGRNPILRGFWSNLEGKLETFKLNMAGSPDQHSPQLLPVTALGFTIVGMSGIGKTKAMEAILSLYPQLIIHSKHKEKNFNWLQVVWLKLECPHDGSTKGLCQNFLAALDTVLGTNYYKQFGRNGSASKNEMLKHIARLASIHTLGMLVIDEVQRVSRAKSGGVGEMLNFFTELVNTIGVPIVLVGTYKALSVLMGEFHQARRGSGQGDLIWNPMKEDEEWQLFVESLWDYQYTDVKCDSTPELIHTLYEVSQGITDIAVKAYMLAQRRAITTGQEVIDESMILSVAGDSIRLANYVLSAMRNGRLYELIDVEDVHFQHIAGPPKVPDQEMSPKPKTRRTKTERKLPDGTSSPRPHNDTVPKIDANLLKEGLREIASQAEKSDVIWYEALKEAGYIKPTENYLVEEVIGE
jgi:hypothetical protein